MQDLCPEKCINKVQTKEIREDLGGYTETMEGKTQHIKDAIFP